jgi:hypothetical protein
MSQASDVLTDAIERIRDGVADTVDDLDPSALADRPGPDANSVGWLLWHLTRVQDAHVAEFLDDEQLYVRDGHAAALGLPEDPHDTGYGHSSEQVAAVRIADPAALVAYHRAVAERSLELLGRESAEDLDRIVDDSWDPPVTAAVRWLSILEDCFMHLGQAQYAAGLRRTG